MRRSRIDAAGDVVEHWIVLPRDTRIRDAPGGSQASLAFIDGDRPYKGEYLVPLEMLDGSADMVLVPGNGLVPPEEAGHRATDDLGRQPVESQVPTQVHLGRTDRSELPINERPDRSIV